MKRRNELIILILYSALIFSISSIRGNEIPSQVSPFSLIFHFFLYFFYSFAIFMYFQRPFHSYLFGTLYAASDEIHQFFVPGRACDPVDFLTDSLALAVGIILVVLWKPLFTFLTSSNRGS